MESCVEANDYRVKMGSKIQTYHVNMLKNYMYIAREPEDEVVTTSDKEGPASAVFIVILQETDPELGVVPDLKGYCQREEVRNVKLGDDLLKNQQHALKT